MPEEHAPYGGSTISRTINCTGWRKLADTLPKQGSSEYADRGTLLHNGSETIMMAEEPDFDPRSVIGTTYKGIELTEELYDEKIVPAMAAIKEIFAEYAVEDFTCEEKVVLLGALSWGTADMLAKGSIIEVDDKDIEHVLKVGICLDYKFGDGIIVEAKGNDQGTYYSTAARETPETADLFEDIDLLVIIIVQPNERGLPDYSVWEVDPSVMDTMKKLALDAIEISQIGKGTFNAGKWCGFCPGQGICPTTSGELQALARLDVKCPDVLKNLPTFEELERVAKTIKSLRSLIHSQLEDGVDIPGFKLVPKRASRVYNDEKAVKEIIRKSRKIKHEDAYEASVKTPPQLEKMCKAKGLDYDKLFGEYVSKVSSGSTLADVSDKREALPGAGALKALADKL